MGGEETIDQAFARDLWDRLVISDPDVYHRLAQLPPEPPEGASA